MKESERNECLLIENIYYLLYQKIGYNYIRSVHWVIFKSKNRTLMHERGKEQATRYGFWYFQVSMTLKDFL